MRGEGEANDDEEEEYDEKEDGEGKRKERGGGRMSIRGERGRRQKGGCLKGVL